MAEQLVGDSFLVAKTTMSSRVLDCKGGGRGKKMIELEWPIVPVCGVISDILDGSSSECIWIKTYKIQWIRIPSRETSRQAHCVNSQHFFHTHAAPSTGISLWSAEWMHVKLLCIEWFLCNLHFSATSVLNAIVREHIFSAWLFRNVQYVCPVSASSYRRARTK